jgi:hypothetical protein
VGGTATRGRLLLNDEEAEDEDEDEVVCKCECESSTLNGMRAGDVARPPLAATLVEPALYPLLLVLALVLIAGARSVLAAAAISVPTSALALADADPAALLFAAPAVPVPPTPPDEAACGRRRARIGRTSAVVRNAISSGMRSSSDSSVGSSRHAVIGITLSAGGIGPTRGQKNKQIKRELNIL